MNTILATQSGQINLNIDQKTLDTCWFSVTNMFTTTYQNNCTGESFVTLFGYGDWLFVDIILIFGLLMVLFFLIFNL